MPPSLTCIAARAEQRHARGRQDNAGCRVIGLEALGLPFVAVSPPPPAYRSIRQECLLACHRPLVCRGRPSTLVGVGSACLVAPAGGLTMCPSSVWRAQVRVGLGVQMCVCVRVLINENIPKICVCVCWPMKTSRKYVCVRVLTNENIPKICGRVLTDENIPKNQ